MHAVNGVDCERAGDMRIRHWKNSRMKRLAIVLTIALPLQARAQVTTPHAAAVAASGCELDESDPIMDARPRPGVREGGTVVATLSGGGGDDLGDLCVALVRERGRRATSVARQSGGPVTVADEVAGLSRGQVAIDAAAYWFARGETAIGVRVGGHYSSTSTEVSWSHLHLLRRLGDKLVPILTVRIDESMADKTEGGGMQSKHWIVRVSRTARRGVYDLVVSAGRGVSTTYSWNGMRYVASRRR